MPQTHVHSHQSAPVRRRKSKKGTTKSPRAAKSATGKAKSPGSTSKRKSSGAKAKASPKKRATSENIEDDDSDEDDEDDSDEGSESSDDGSDDYQDTPARKVKAPAAKAFPTKASPAKKTATPATVDDEDDVPLSALASKGKAPTDEQLRGQIIKIISSSDLGTITNRSVREQLEKHFGVDLTERFAAIKEMITEVLTKA